MPEYLWKAHPFLPASLLRPSRIDEVDTFEKVGDASNGASDCDADADPGSSLIETGSAMSRCEIVERTCWLVSTQKEWISPEHRLSYRQLPFEFLMGVIRKAGTPLSRPATTIVEEICYMDSVTKNDGYFREPIRIWVCGW